MNSRGWRKAAIHRESHLFRPVQRASEMTDPVALIREARERGMECFNRGAWREAVDEWEAAYHAIDGAGRKPWLGIIRVTAALHHFSLGHPYSARRLWASGREILAGLEPNWWGIDVPALLRELDPVFAPLLAVDEAGASELRPAGQPRIQAG